MTVLTGARQVEKSTLLKHAFPDFSYLTLDDYLVSRNGSHSARNSD
jgi:predicted kinase